MAGLWLLPPAADIDAATLTPLGGGDGEVLRVGVGCSVGAAEGVNVGALVGLACTNSAEGAALDTGEAEGLEAGADVGPDADDGSEAQKDPDEGAATGAGAVTGAPALPCLPRALKTAGANVGLVTAATPVGGTVGCATVGRALATGRRAG